MGVGSFGGISPGMAYMATRGFKGGYGGGSEPSDNKGSNFSWIWFSFNTLLILIMISFFTIMKSDYANYTRVGVLQKKNQSEHKVKSNYYPDYYFTVKWTDREQERETFEVGGQTYFSCEVNEKVYFRRMKPDWEWMKDGSGFVFIMSIALIWVVSGTLAILRES